MISNVCFKTAKKMNFKCLTLENDKSDIDMLINMS